MRRPRSHSAATTAPPPSTRIRPSPFAAPRTRPFQIALDAGTTAGASLGQRLLAGPGGETLQYNLYTTVAQNTIWGNNAGGTGWVTGVGGGLAVANQVTQTVFGNLPNNAYEPGGRCRRLSDLITATITY